jgi:hypothetical protein
MAESALWKLPCVDRRVSVYADDCSIADLWRTACTPVRFFRRYLLPVGAAVVIKESAVIVER